MVKEGYQATIIGELPVDWDCNFLSDVLNSLISGNRPKGGVRNIEDGIPSLGGEHINDTGSFDFEEMRYVPESFYRDMNKGKIKDNDILICKDGAKTGKIAYLEESPFKKASINEHIFILRSDNTKIKSKFLFYFLFSKKGQDQIKKLITGSAQPGINRKFVNPILIPCPSLSEQEKISSILSSVDESIERTDKLIEKTKELKRGLMQQLLTKGIGHSEFKEVRIGAKRIEIPKHWGISTVNELTSKVQYGISEKMYLEGQYPIFRMNNFYRGYMIDEPMKYIDLDDTEFEKYKVKKGDILFNRTNSVDLVGKNGIFTLEGDYVFASYLIRLRTNDKCDSYYLNYYLNSYNASSILDSIATRGASQANINAKNLKSVDVPTPPIQEQKQIASILSSVDAKIQKEEEYKEKLERLKKGLMQKLLTGEIRVNTDMEV